MKAKGLRAGVAAVAVWPPEGTYLTKAQMAAALQVSVRTISAMMSREGIPFLRLRGRFIRFRPEHVQRHLNKTALVCAGGEDAAQKLKAETLKAEMGTGDREGGRSATHPTSGQKLKAEKGDA